MLPGIVAQRPFQDLGLPLTKVAVLTESVQGSILSETAVQGIFG